MLEHAARNAFLGDGYLWKHPECREYKAIWTSVNLDWLEAKLSLFAELCSPHITRTDRTRHACFPNAKPIFTLRSYANPIFSEYQQRTKASVIQELTLIDLALWYMDDGCLILRKKNGRINGFRFCLCVGDVIGVEAVLLDRIRSITGLTHVGKLYRNNSRATERNKTLYLVNAAGEIIANEAAKFAPPSMFKKIPSLRFND